jgi:PAS domain-containing protein
MLTGMAERQMCVSYMRKVANDKASVLLQRMPFGVVLVDQRLHIIECNQIFAKMAGADAQLLWEAMPGLKNADLRKLLKFHNIFTNVLSSGADVIDRDFEHQGRHYSVSVFTIQKNRIVCGIMQDLNHSGLAGEEVNRRIRKVIYNNMLTVQKVAAILGENAVQTQVLLNTLIHSEENERKP